MADSPGGLRRVVAALRRHHGPPEAPGTADPFELILWENVAYLAAPQRRREAFEVLRRTIGTSPAALFAASPQALARIARRGILEAATADKIRACAAIAMEKFGGNLGEVVRGPIDGAKRALRAFPSIGEPGAEKVLLFCGRAPLLAPESNGLRDVRAGGEAPLLDRRRLMPEWASRALPHREAPPYVPHAGRRKARRWPTA